MRPCLRCGSPSAGSYCPEHEPRRPDRSTRKPAPYRWRVLSERWRKLSPFSEVCGTDRDLTLDHRAPVARGGKHAIANAQVLCRFHNSQKGDSLPVPPASFPSLARGPDSGATTEVTVRRGPRPASGRTSEVA